MSQSPEQAADHLIDLAADGDSVAGSGVERRTQHRVSYDALVAVMPVESDGMASEPFVVRAHDISLGGLSVLSGRFLPENKTVVVQLVRSSGSTALVGATVRHCHTVRPVEHHIGLAFCQLPDEIGVERFLDENGCIQMLDPLLRDNQTTDS